MTATQSHAPWTFCWANLATVDIEAAKSFYAAIFDWTAEDLPTDLGPRYTLFSLATQPVCGAFPLRQDQDDHPFWATYACVADLDEILASAQNLGGQIAMPAMDIMDEGRLAVIQDPTGAHLGLWQPRQHLGYATTNVPGAVCWHELQTRDRETASVFYRGLFGWDVKPFERYPDGTYQLFLLDGRNVGGMLAIGDAWEQVPPHWSIYFGVTDCDATVAKCVWLGGRLLAPVVEIGGVGRFARLQDPQGTVFSVIARSQR
jgi:uncharacterized protein